MYVCVGENKTKLTEFIYYKPKFLGWLVGVCDGVFLVVVVGFV